MSVHVILGAGGVQPAARPARPVRVAPRGLLTSLVLSSPGGSVDVLARPWRLQSGSRGLTTVTMNADTVKVPGRDGVVRRRVAGGGLTGEARDVELPLFLGHHPSVATPEALSAEVQRLQGVLNERAFRSGELLLTGTRADGTTRYARCVHTPVAGDLDPLAFWQTVWMPTLRLLVADPWFRSAAPPITWRQSLAVPPMLPFFPLRIGSGTVTGSANPVNVLGDEVAWPTLTVTGPASSITVSRGDGTSWTLIPPAPLLAGETVTVRHDPATGVADDLETVEGPDGSPWYRYLQPGSVLWGLRPGMEQVSVVLPGGAPGVTEATIAWEHRHRSML